MKELTPNEPTRSDASPFYTLVAEENFILATRDTGYRDITAAVAELIDNSLQAGARKVRVYVHEEHRESSRGIVLGVLDDGHGMSPSCIQTALRFGGTERFNDRSGFGRFGMGLPNSSVSQTRRLEVYSWRAGADVHSSYLDIDDVVAGKLRFVPTPVSATLPPWISEPYSLSGTLVLWARCDRIARFRASTIARRLHGALGRLYRYAIWDGARIFVNGANVDATDPLLLDKRSPVSGATAYGPPMRFEFAVSNNKKALVHVRFSELPVEEWQDRTLEQKRLDGIIGGAGASIVRAGREIDYGWYLMGSKRRENYDDWWRCEIRFEPELDEWFGVTHSKQGITPSPELRDALNGDLGAVARTLNARVRAAFERAQLARSARGTAADVASRNDPFLPAFPVGATLAGGFRYRIEYATLPCPDFYDVKLKRNTIIVSLNLEHPFFTHVYKPACQAGRERERHTLECLLFAAARADVEGLNTSARGAEQYRRAWSDALAAFIDV